MVKYISQINRGFVMFFKKENSLLSWLDCEQYRKNQYKKKEYKQHSSMFKVLRCLSYYLNLTDLLMIPVIDTFSISTRKGS